MGALAASVAPDVVVAARRFWGGRIDLVRIRSDGRVRDGVDRCDHEFPRPVDERRRVRPVYEDYHIPTRPMTADDVFAVIVEVTRQAGPEDSSDFVNELSFETPVREWLLTDEFIGYELATTLEPFRLRPVSVDEWTRAIGGAEKHRTLGDVCRALAPHFAMLVIEPVNIMGDRSRAAGAFLVVRRLLDDVGVDVSDLRPSSE